MDEDDNEMKDDFTNVDVDVIIVGGGIAGLTAALKLNQKEPSIKIRILETCRQIGGQLVRCPLGELGGTAIIEDQEQIYNLVRAFDIPLNRRTIAHSGDKRNWDLDYGISSGLVKFELARYIRELDTKLYQYKDRKKTDMIQTMKNQIEAKLFFQKSRNFIKNVVLLSSGADASCVLAHDFMQIMSGYGGMKRFLELYFLFPETLLEFDSRKLLIKIRRRLSNVDIITSRKVMEIHLFKDFVKVVDSINQCHCASVVLLAVPWYDILNLQYYPNQPNFMQISPSNIKQQQYVITSMLARFSKPFWHQSGYSGILYIEDPFIIGHEYSENVYYCMYVHSKREMHGLDEKILHHLSNAFGSSMSCPLELHMKSYQVGYHSPSKKIKKIERIIWSSAEVTGSCYKRSLNGAVESGLKAAFQALLILRPQSVSWQDAAEVDCKSRLLNTDTSWFYRMTTSWNLYNFSFYSFILAGLLLGTRALL